MVNPYGELFTRPGTHGFALAGLIARFPLAMAGIGIITMLAMMRDNYALAGAVAATFALTLAVLAPQISRMVDRFGQRKVLPGAAAVSCAGLVALPTCAYWQLPDWSLFIGAVMSGFMPSMSAMSRARWTLIYRGTPKLNTAYALESVLDEVTFIVGPPLAVGLSVALFPQAGPLVTALLLAIGVYAFVLQRSTEPPVQALSGARQLSMIRLSGIRILALLMVAMGMIVGTIDVVAVAFAQSQGQPVAASIVLSAYALGSCVAGLAFGAMKLQVPLARLFLCCGVATAVTTLPLLLASNVLGLTLAVLVAGIFFAPTLIVAMTLAEQMVAPERLTEALTWLISGLGVGVALGAAATGQVVDELGARQGAVIALVAGMTVLGIALYGHRRLKPDVITAAQPA
ncbi:MFS transporter [Pseudomonas atagonensis]|uniref:MFS transporter n=1 Tax=Pseudomonas atagonensis TaxID=2609964 RepID=UPI00140C8917|nr:MFS transporter [Pseudomonas atagonensis]